MFGGGFGQTQTQNAQAPAGGFNFGSSTGTTTTASTGGFSFGGAAPTTAPAASGFTGFGLANPAAASSAAPTTSAGGGFGGFSFGAAATRPATTGFSFGLGQPATQTSQAPTLTGFNFGGATQTAAPTATTAPAAATTTSAAGFGGFFGMKQPGSTAATTTTASVPTLGGLSGFGAPTPASTSAAGSALSGLLAAASTAATTTAPTMTAPSGFSLGTTPASSARTGLSGFSLGATTTSQAGTAPTLGGGLGLGGFGATSSQTVASTSTTTTTASSTAAPTLGGGSQKQMTFRQLEDTINKWTTELEEQERYFLNQATQVNAWDRIVMENGEKIIQLSQDVERVKLDQQKLDHELDFVHSQQKELEELLEPLEKALDNLPPISHQQHAHLEREHTYMLAESLDTQLKRMGQDLKEIVERLNSNTSKPDSNDPVQQITKILNAHVVSLMWVDRNSADLQRRVEEIAKLMESEKREQERNFRLAYS